MLFVCVFSLVKILLVLEHFSERCSYCKFRQFCWEDQVLFAFLSFSSLSIFLPLFTFSEEEEDSGLSYFVFLMPK